MKRISQFIFAILLSLCAVGLTSCDWFNDTHTIIEIIGGENWMGSTTVTLVSDETTGLTKLVTFTEAGTQCRVMTGIYGLSVIDTELLNVKKEEDTILLTHMDSGKTLYTCICNKDNEGKVTTMTMNWSIHTDYERMIRDNPLTVTLKRSE
ncbi:MAG TPA: hypothetical protein PL115_02690 [Bacteroidales bacterium]|jgi:hypothetical protein|nr:hypothetical protein [Bacteroidales bacterium]HKM13117.1 hypothetical protein [Bacteroidales bacterium]HPB89191.1 hypothetical protein [Bacteroidales bacterium]HQA92645.1 hypothetical protein [Bacteroidales bacterium]HQN23694.1 hypothetical protein [Bacteroidales bacterium]